MIATVFPFDRILTRRTQLNEDEIVLFGLTEFHVSFVAGVGCASGRPVKLISACKAPSCFAIAHYIVIVELKIFVRASALFV